jgi:hypothetical protein
VYNLSAQGKRDMKTTCITIFLFLLSLSAIAREPINKDHLIYSVSEEIPMGYENEVTKRNFYLNIGSNQGVSAGTVLDVFRVISRINPYENLTRVKYKVKIGQIKVLHSDDEAAIGIMTELKDETNTQLIHLKGFMIGDHVAVNTNS